MAFDINTPGMPERHTVSQHPPLHVKGIQVNEWLVRFFDPGNYPDQTCAIFDQGNLVGFSDDFAGSMKTSLSGGSGGSAESDRGKARYAVSLLHPPYSNLNGHRLEQVNTVRKSMDAIFAAGQRCGSKNAWINTVTALLAQASSLFLSAASQYRSEYNGQHRRQSVCAYPYLHQSESIGVEEKLEAAFCAVRNLDHYCSTCHEVKRLLGEKRPRLDILQAAIADSCLYGGVHEKALLRYNISHDLDQGGNGRNDLHLSDVLRALRVFLVWNDYSKESDSRFVAAMCVAHLHLLQ